MQAVRPAGPDPMMMTLRASMGALLAHQGPRSLRAIEPILGPSPASVVNQKMQQEGGKTGRILGFPQTKSFVIFPLPVQFKSLANRAGFQRGFALFDVHAETHRLAGVTLEE